MSSTPSFAQVALPVGLRRIFTYEVPGDLRDRLRPGHRVRVPFGRTTTFGYVTGFTNEAPSVELKRIESLEPDEVLLSPEILRLSKWVADYYLAPWGQVLEAALPPSVRRSGGRRPRQAAAGADVGPPGSVPTTAAATSAGSGDLPDQTGGVAQAAESRYPYRLTSAQDAAVGEIGQSLTAGRFAPFLLHGVTGSGKTEVYLQVADRVLREEGQVLFLVPEIAMGTQIVARVHERFVGRVGLFHSQTGEGRRRAVWESARDGRLSVVVGTRSAVFVPLPRLRLVVIDEEHEWAYKQEESPRYHGRDVAVMRASLANAVAILGSATPSLESLWNADRGKYRRLRLPERVDGRPAAKVMVVDLKPGVDGDGGTADHPSVSRNTTGGTESGTRSRGVSPGRRNPVSLLSPALIRAVQHRLEQGEQTILFLNRRGHSPIVQCSECGQSVACRHCDVAMTWHKAGTYLRCHYCNAIRRDVDRCDACQGSRFFFGGFGTQRLEEELEETFPEARVARMDFDAVRRRGAHGRLVGAMERGEVDVLLGTQMVAKGFHFPRVTLVGVLQADREILQPDFRAPERAFQILTQVAGRAGRGMTPGEVIFQSMIPDHPVLVCVLGGDYEGFAQQELTQRRTLSYPPFHRMIDLLVDGPTEDQVRRRAELARRILESEAGTGASQATEAPSSGIAGLEAALRGGATDVLEILGPAPMIHARLKGRHRWHLTVKGGSSERLHRAVQRVLEEPPAAGLTRTRIQPDVDPLGTS